MPYKDRDAQREYQRKWVANRRAEWFSDKSCIVCGSTDKLELDHIDASQKISHNIWSWSWERIEEEVAKCQVLCRYHHQIKTERVELVAYLGREIRQHGTISMCFNGCRCELCTKANTAKQQRRRARLRDEHDKYIN